MARQCPPGVFCIENYTILAIFCILFVVLSYLFLQKPKQQQIAVEEPVEIYETSTTNDFFVRPNQNLGFSTQPTDVLLNPYAPPLSDSRYFVPPLDVRGPPGVPINIRTQGFNSAYRQVGILTDESGKEQILALMGRPLISNRDKWQYYTMSEKNNIKLPVSVKGKSCMNEYGCDQIYDGDTVYVQGYNGVFRATIYDNNTMQYIPF